MIKLKILTEKKEKKKDKKEKEAVYPEIIMLPDSVMNKERFVKFMKDVYDVELKFN